MKKKLLSLLLLVCVACSALTGCLLDSTGSEGNGSSNGGSVSTESSGGNVEKIDYASRLTLDMDSPTQKMVINPTDSRGDKNYMHIDGDTTHFYVDRSFTKTGILKARYLAIDTPESTGVVEEWGMKASNFTKTALANSDSIIVESEKEIWTTDSNGRYLAWVWHRPKGSNTYRLLNLELLQEGLAAESKTEGAIYGEICAQAAAQARNLKLYVNSTEKDPDFYYGAALPVDLKTVRMNLAEYENKRLLITGLVTVSAGTGSIYIEYYDEEEDRCYGLPIFYGYGNPSYSIPLAPGNEVRISALLTNSDNFGYQLSSIPHNPLKDDPENIKVFSTGNTPVCPEVTYDQLKANNFAYAEIAKYSSISMKNLTVVDTYTTNNGGNNDGAISITVKDANNNEFVVRTGVLKNADGSTVKEDAFPVGSVLDVRGILDVYEGNYQVRVFSARDISVHA